MGENSTVTFVLYNISNLEAAEGRSGKYTSRLLSEGRNSVVNMHILYICSNLYYKLVQLVSLWPNL